MGKGEWSSRLFVMTDSAVFWFDTMPNTFGVMSLPIGTQCGRIDVRHFVSMSVVERPTGAEGRQSTEELPTSETSTLTSLSGSPGLAYTRTHEIERVGPRHTLEIHTITAEQTLVLGSTDRNVIDAWLAVFSKAVGTVGERTGVGVGGARVRGGPRP